MVMPGRSFVSSGGDYRFGFNGMEKDGDFSGVDGGHLDFKFRIHDARLGRFLSTDPIGFALPWNSPYSFAENDVISSIDIEGLEKKKVIHYTDGVYPNGDIKIIKTEVEIQKDIVFQGTNGELYAMTEVFVKLKNGEQYKIDEVYELISPNAPKPSANYDYTQGVIPGKQADDIDYMATDMPIGNILDILKRDKNAPDNSMIIEDLGGVEASLFLSLSPLQRNLYYRAITQNINKELKVLSGTQKVDDVMKAGEAFVGKNATTIYKSDGQIASMISADGLKRFRPPTFKRSISELKGETIFQANFEMKTSKSIKWGDNGTTNLHINTDGSYYK
jgi:RHS repeat-associated protein